MHTKNSLKIIIALCILALIVMFFTLDLSRYLSFEFLKNSKDAFAIYYSQHKQQTLVIFSLIYISVTALSLPGAAILTLAAGALFGFTVGTILVSISSTIGATLAFLLARYLFQNYVQSKYANNLITINQGISKEGSFYLFALRLVPLFPFFLINLVMGLTKIKVLSYLIVSWIAMLPGTMAYIFAGTELGNITSLKGILSPKLLIAFTILGLLPLLAKKLLNLIRSKHNRWKSL